MLIVGVDTFISLADADNYTKSMYTEGNELYDTWFGLTDEAKEAWLRRSTKALDRLKYQGEKLRYSQTLQFPRKIKNYNGGFGWAWDVSFYYDNQHIAVDDLGLEDGGMSAIAEATIENALYGSVLDKSMISVSVASIAGLTSKKAGSVSETYNRSSHGNRNAMRDIFTDKVYSILVQWVIGSYHNI